MDKDEGFQVSREGIRCVRWGCGREKKDRRLSSSLIVKGEEICNWNHSSSEEQLTIA